MKLTLFSLSMLPLCATAGMAQGPAPVVEAPALAAARALQILPTGGLLAPPARLSPTPFGSLLGHPEGLPVVALLGGPDSWRPLFEPEQLVAAILAGVGSEAEPALHLDVAGERLLASGPLDLVDVGKRRLGAILDQAGRVIVLEARLYRLGEKVPGIPAALGADELASLTRGLPLLWSATGNARTGQHTRLGSVRRVRHVAGIGTEVAQKASVADPLTAELQVGTEVMVEPHLLAGSSDLVVFAQFATSELVGEIGTISTGVALLPSLDAPHLRCASGGCSGRVRDGGALAITLAGDGDFQRLLVLTAKAGGSPADLEKLGTLPITALVSQALALDLVSLHDFPRDWLHDGDAEAAKPSSLEESTLEGLVAAAFGGTTPAGVTRAGSFYLVTPESENAKKVVAVLKALEDQMFRTQQLDLTIATEVDAQAARRGAADEPAALPGAVRLPMLPAFHHPLVFGQESRAIIDYDVEIAQEAAIMCPVVTTVFRGITLAARAVERPQGSPMLEARLALSSGPPPRRRALEGTKGGEVQRTDTEVAKWFVCPASTSFEGGDGPRSSLSGQSQRTKPTLALTELGRPASR